MTAGVITAAAESEESEAAEPAGAVTARYLHVFSAANATTAGLKVTNFTLPNLHHVPTVGTDNFGASGAAFITGWIDGGFHELKGALFKLHCDALNLSATSTVKVEYQIDDAENSAWVQMVDSANVADVFDSAAQVMYFSAATPKRGIEFRNVRFRITLNRGGTATDSPEVRALTLVYLKKPSYRSSYKLRIDVNRMIERTATGADTTFQVDGLAATMKRVYDKIVTIWNTKPLVPLIIPNLEPSPGINVMIADMPLSFDDFRDAIDGLGFIDLQLLEPVER